MSKHSHLAVSILAVAVAVAALAHRAHASGDGPLQKDELVKIAPAPGVAAVGKFTGTWCAHAGGDDLPTAIGRSTSADGLWEGAGDAARFACADPDEPVFQQQVGYYIQRWVNLTGQSPAAVGEFLALRMDADRWEQLATETCTKLAPSDTASLRELVLDRVAMDVMGCSGGYAVQPSYLTYQSSVGNDAWIWQIDRVAAPPSQLAAIDRILRCEGTADPKDLVTLVRFAACRNEVQFLDEKALLAELKAGGFNDEARVVALQNLGAAKLRATWLEQALAAKVAGDAELKTLLIDVPAQAWKDWVAEYEANKEAYTSAYAYEDKRNSGRKSAALGCLADAHRDLSAFTATIKGATIDDVLTAATTPRGMLLLERARSCNEAEGHDGVAAAYALAISYGRPGRGPRTAVYMAMQRELSRILADRDRFAVTGEMLAIDLDGPGAKALGDAKGVNDRFGTAPIGTVGKIVKKGDRVFVTFKTLAWKEPEVSCVDTTRITMFRPDGSPIYQQRCTRTGKTIERNETPEPFWMWAALADGVEPGTVVRYSTQAGQGDTRVDGVFQGFPYVVWQDREQKRVVAVLGLRAH